MPNYLFLLDAGLGRPLEELVVATDDVEAERLARQRLKRPGFMQVAVGREGRMLKTVSREVVSGR